MIATIPRAPQRLRRLAVVDARSRVLVTVIEMLSPSNKNRGADRDQYARKNEVILNGANLVEIDLLRGGPPLPLVVRAPHDYRVVIGRRAEWPEVGVWPIRLRDRLPRIPVPLTPGGLEPEIDLQTVFEQTFAEGGYEHYIYRGEPDPPLVSADAKWAETLLAGTGG